MNRRSSLSRQILLLACTLALAGCSEEPELMNPASGDLAPDFVLPTLDGQHWRLNQQRGRVLLINFWATWCAPCRREMPALDRLNQQLGGTAFEVIGVHVGPSADIEKFLEETPVSFPILMDEDLQLDGWGVRALPSTFLIDAQGHARYWAIGEREWDSSQALEFFNNLLS